MMHSYVPIEYPKWLDGVLVQNVEEEQARREVLHEVAATARAAELTRSPSPAGIRMRRTRERRREGCSVILDRHPAACLKISHRR
jgi:hypothetical protein